MEVAEKPIRIATVYRRNLDETTPSEMSLIRWLRISEALASLGYEVDVIVNTKRGLVRKNTRLRYVPYSMVDWTRYDIVKTLYQSGFESLCYEGADDHPFIISRLASVVGSNDSTEGVYFFNEQRQRLFELQKRINEKSK